MKVSYTWLSEYVDLSGYTAAELAEVLTRSGVEVDGVEPLNKGVSSVVVGYVTETSQHPNADKLSVCTVDVGAEEALQIVCGAPNVAAGQKVPVALVNAILPGDFKIKKAKLRGVESHGMICSAKELGMNDRLLAKEVQEGILVLPEEAPIGADVTALLGLNDEVLELDLTPNRSDCLSMIGVAYEMSAILERDIALPPLQLAEHEALDAQSVLNVHIASDSEANCQHYSARVIDRVKIGPAPLWMQNRLMAAGIRPINNIVDITNYVMLECGQPLHAFDANKITSGQIEVRQAQQGEKLVTLDGIERELDPSMLLITDGSDPIGIAGVMGGQNSEVTAQTTRIVLESAKFNGIAIRKTSKQLGMRSEASLRFEKETDPQAVISALDRAAELMALYAGGVVARGIVEHKVGDDKEQTIELTLKRVNALLGTTISLDEVKAIFNRLSFRYTVDEVAQSLTIVIPSRRGDITRDVDLIEEIARLYGYDHIPTTLSSGETTPGALNYEQKISRSLRRLLAEHGLYEVVNYSLTRRDTHAWFPGLFPQTERIELKMPMSEDRAVLRTSLIPHLLDNAVYNRNRNNRDIALFEMGHVFLTDEQTVTKLPTEKVLLSALLTGERHAAHWSGEKGRVDFYDMKGIVELLLNYSGVTGVTYAPAQPSGYHPGRTAAIQLRNENGQAQTIGYIGQLHPELQQDLELDDTYIMELELEPLLAQATFQIEYNALPRYPAISRDIALVVDKALPAASIVENIKQTAGTLLESLKVFDVFIDERLGDNKKSIALSCVYRHAERTLTDEEVTDLHDQVVASLEQTFQAELRKI